jgi:hypothetical protein
MAHISPKNNGILFVVVMVVVILVSGTISYVYLKQKVTAPEFNPSTTSTPQTTNKTYLNKDLGLSFDYPNIFELSTDPPNNSMVLLASKYFVETNFEGKKPVPPSNETLLPKSSRHYFKISLEKKPFPLVEAMKQDNPFFAETFNDFLLHKKPKTAMMEVSQIDGIAAYTFTSGAEGINTKYVYIQRGTMETMVIVLTYIGDSLKNSIQPSSISEALQLAIFNNFLSTIKFNQ